MKVGDLVQPRDSAVLGTPEEWGFTDREEMVAKVRAFHGVGVVVSEPHTDAALWTEPVVEILWSGLDTTQKQPLGTVEVINESR